MKLFLEKIIFPLVVLLVGALMVTNPWRFNLTQRISGAFCLISAAVFLISYLNMDIVAETPELEHSPDDANSILNKKRNEDVISAPDLTRQVGEKSSTLSNSSRVTFNYSNFDGVYRLGTGDSEFITHWSKASDTSIHCYRDGTNIKALAEFKKITDLLIVRSTSDPEFTSRVRTPAEGGFIILQNIFDQVALLKILDIKDASRSDNRDELTFEYIIFSSFEAMTVYLGKFK